MCGTSILWNMIQQKKELWIHVKNVNKPPENYTDWKEPLTKDYTLWHAIYVTFLESYNNRNGGEMSSCRFKEGWGRCWRMAGNGQANWKAIPNDMLCEMKSAGEERKEPSDTISGNVKLVLPLWRTVWRFPKKWKKELPFDPAIPLLDIYPEKTLTRKDTHTPVFIAPLFTTAKTCKQPKCPSVDEWIKKVEYTYTMEY